MPASPIPQVRILSGRNERIGMGFNSESGLAVGTALEGFTVDKDPNAPGQDVESTITIISSQEELTEELGLSVEAKGRYGFFSGSAKASFTSRSSYNTTSTFLLAKVIVKNPFLRGRDFKVTEPAQNLLESNQMDVFKTAFGDSFIRGLQTGGEFFSVIRITSVSSTTQKELAADLKLAYDGLITEAEFSNKFNKANSNASTRSELSAIMLQRAGTGDEISPTTNPSEVLARMKAFPSIVLNSPVAYEFEVATYDTLPLPIPTPEEQENFFLTLRDTRDKKLNYVQLKNDLEFAQENPWFFESLPEDDTLQKDISTYTRLLNALIDHGTKLSTGRMNPPQFFDPQQLNPPIIEPEKIVLKRVSSSSEPATPIEVRSLKFLFVEMVRLVQDLQGKLGRVTVLDVKQVAESFKVNGILYYLGDTPTQPQIDFITSGVSLAFPPELIDSVDIKDVVIVGQSPNEGVVPPGTSISFTFATN
jgi:hypothetical protein